jgi:hypothetical protein
MLITERTQTSPAMVYMQRCGWLPMYLMLTCLVRAGNSKVAGSGQDLGKNPKNRSLFQAISGSGQDLGKHPNNRLYFRRFSYPNSFSLLK